MDLVPDVLTAKALLQREYKGETGVGKNLGVPDGWACILRDLYDIREHMTYVYGIQIKVAQVKVKFGTFRFYTDGFTMVDGYFREEATGAYTRLMNSGVTLRTPQPNSDAATRVVSEFYGAIRTAGHVASRTCMECGRNGRRRPLGYQILCEGCWEEVREEEERKAVEYEQDMKEYTDGKAEISKGC